MGTREEGNATLERIYETIRESGEKGVTINELVKLTGLSPGWIGRGVWKLGYRKRVKERVNPMSEKHTLYYTAENTMFERRR